MRDLKYLKDVANSLRRDVLNMTSNAGSGHPSSCLSCAEIMSVLFFNEMKYDINDSENPDSDEFILSKGHAAPIWYACLQKAGCIGEDLMALRKLWSPLEGHPMPGSLKWAKVATGSLGQGLSIGAGMALAGKLSKRKYRTYVLLGDSEIAEGSVWEAAELAAYYNLDNLCAIVDVNRLGQRGETMLGHDLKAYKKRFESFGWNAIIVDGHDVIKLNDSFYNARTTRQPTVVLAKTIKGRSISFIEGKNGWHGKVLNTEELEKALEELPEISPVEISVEKPAHIKIREFKTKKHFENNYKLGEEIATREAYGKAIANLAKVNPRILAIDAETSNSTFAEEVKKVNSEQFIEAFIAEQNMIGMALGLSVKGYNVFASSFAAFLSRAHDQIRMCALSNGNFTVCGSHCGVPIGEDGASQMGLEDIGMFRALPSGSVLYPCDATSCEKLVYLASQLPGIKYIRTSRPRTPVVYKSDENFLIGDFKVLRENEGDKAVLVGSGITVFEALRAHNELLKNKIKTSVIDLYCIKPFNKEKFIEFVKKHGNRIVIAEDHYKEGGIGEMLSSAVSNSGILIKTLAVNRIAHSGTKDELLVKSCINSKTIIDEAMNLINFNPIEEKKEVIEMTIKSPKKIKKKKK